MAQLTDWSVFMYMIDAFGICVRNGACIRLGRKMVQTFGRCSGVLMNICKVSCYVEQGDDETTLQTGNE